MIDTETRVWVETQEWFPKFCTNLVKNDHVKHWFDFKTHFEEEKQRLICGGFQWPDTPEGIKYWSDINLQWLKYLDEHNLLNNNSNE